MNAKEQASYIDKTGLMAVLKSLRVPVIIRDVRQVFHRIDLLVSPLGGPAKAHISIRYKESLTPLPLSG